jgi:chromosome segregation ATPase
MPDRAVDAARHLHAEAGRRHHLAGLEVETAEADLAAARAAARLAEIARDEGDLRGRLPALDNALASAEAEEEAAQEAWGTARDATANHASLVLAASAEARLASTKAQQEREGEAAARRARDELRIGYWQNG